MQNDNISQTKSYPHTHTRILTDTYKQWHTHTHTRIYSYIHPSAHFWICPFFDLWPWPTKMWLSRSNFTWTCPCLALIGIVSFRNTPVLSYSKHGNCFTYTRCHKHTRIEVICLKFFNFSYNATFIVKFVFTCLLPYCILFTLSCT